MSGPLRFSARLVGHLDEIDGRWHAGRDDLDEICRLAMAQRRKGEIAVVVDHGSGESWRIELDGDELQKVPL